MRSCNCDLLVQAHCAWCAREAALWLTAGFITMRRHLYASTKPTIEQRIDSWDNYRELFSGEQEEHSTLPVFPMLPDLRCATVI